MKKEIELKKSNLYITGKGKDSNGNTVLKLKFPSSTKSFSVQTNGNLPKTHAIISRLSAGVKGFAKATDEELETIEKEVVDYLREHGSALQKRTLKAWFKNGGGIGFEELSKKVAKKYEGKRVPKKYQDEYGKVYSKEEAKEVGDKVAGKIKAEQFGEGGSIEDALEILKLETNLYSMEKYNEPIDEETFMVSGIKKDGEEVKFRFVVAETISGKDIKLTPTQLFDPKRAEKFANGGQISQTQKDAYKFVDEIVEIHKDKKKVKQVILDRVNSPYGRTSNQFVDAMWDRYNMTFYPEDYKHLFANGGQVIKREYIDEFADNKEFEGTDIQKDAQKIGDWIYSQKWSDDKGSLSKQRAMKIKEFEDKHNVYVESEHKKFANGGQIESDIAKLEKLIASDNPMITAEIKAKAKKKIEELKHELHESKESKEEEKKEDESQIKIGQVYRVNPDSKIVKGKGDVFIVVGIDNEDVVIFNVEKNKNIKEFVTKRIFKDLLRDGEYILIDNKAIKTFKDSKTGAIYTIEKDPNKDNRFAIYSESKDWARRIEFDNLVTLDDAIELAMVSSGAKKEFEPEKEFFKREIENEKKEDKKKYSEKIKMYIPEIKRLTGTSNEAVERFIDDNNLSEEDVYKLMQGLGQKKLHHSEFVTALIGKNKDFTKRFIKAIKSESKMVHLEPKFKVGDSVMLKDGLMELIVDSYKLDRSKKYVYSGHFKSKPSEKFTEKESELEAYKPSTKAEKPKVAIEEVQTKKFKGVSYHKLSNGKWATYTDSLNKIKGAEFKTESEVLEHIESELNKGKKPKSEEKKVMVGKNTVHYISRITLNNKDVEIGDKVILLQDVTDKDILNGITDVKIKVSKSNKEIMFPLSNLSREKIKQSPKETSSWKDKFNALKKKKEYKGKVKKETKPVSGTKSRNIKRDLDTQALPKGKRVSKNGRSYYEYRSNRSDISSKDKFEKGGEVKSNDWGINLNW